MRDREQEMLDLVEQCYEYEGKLEKLRVNRAEVQDRYNQIYYRRVKEVALAMDERGKRIYSNEALRRAEVSLRLAQDEEAMGLRERLRELRLEGDQIIREINRLRSRLDILKGFAKDRGVG